MTAIDATQFTAPAEIDLKDKGHLLSDPRAARAALSAFSKATCG
jgi:hypothetical protein